MSNVGVTIPIIPREVAEAIEGMRRSCNTNAQIAHAAFDTDMLSAKRSVRVTTIREYAAKNPDTFMIALAVGYEREKTAEELAEEARHIAEVHIRAEYKRKGLELRLAMAERDVADVARACGFRNGIKFTLNELGVKISEVNA